MASLIRLSSVLREGAVAGLQIGISYHLMTKTLGEPVSVGETDTGYGALYGDLEIWFGKERGRVRRDRCSLVYLNRRIRHAPIRIRSSRRFQSEGLRWGMSPKDVCVWLVDRKIPFEYSGDSTEAVKLADIGRKGRGMIFREFDEGVLELGEIYFAAEQDS